LCPVEDQWRVPEVNGMPLEPFHRFFPDVAEAEVRTIHIIDDPVVPPGDYALIELYCTEPGCDCERVMLSVIEQNRGIVASISYGLNPAKTPKWFDAPNPFLDPINPQSPYAPAILELVKEIALGEEYVERLSRHDQMVRSAVEGGKSYSDRRMAWDDRPAANPEDRRAIRARWMQRIKKAARRKKPRR
jgi:hypothetical protein